MEEERIKSALEIAMERVSGLPELTPEEIAEQKEKEYKPIGESLSKKYLNGIIADSDLSAEIEKHQGDRGRIVRRAFALSLCGSIQLGNAGIAIKALQGIEHLRAEKGNFFEKARGDYLKILNDFEQDKKKHFREFENLAREKLHSLGISGSAASPNLSEDESLQRELGRILQAYEPRLDKLRSTLLGELKDV